jgi:hypothetical protein
MHDEAVIPDLDAENPRTVGELLRHWDDSAQSEFDLWRATRGADVVSSWRSMRR